MNKFMKIFSRSTPPPSENKGKTTSRSNEDLLQATKKPKAENVTPMESKKSNRKSSAAGLPVAPRREAPKGPARARTEQRKTNTGLEVKADMDRLLEEKTIKEGTLAITLKDKESEVEELRNALEQMRESKKLEVDALSHENMILRARLLEVSDGSTAGGAEAGLHDIAMVEAEGPCPTPDWDKHSCSSLSEVSVAGLQDRIMQMEETHHSTNEELQATLQELADLQAQLTDIQTDNDRLTEEKNVLLESLCQQTEKLGDTRNKVDTLQQLLLKDKEGDSCTEREQKLVDLLKSAQDEREVLLLKQEEQNNQLTDLRCIADSGGQEADRLHERVRMLESTVEASHAERKQLDQELILAREESSSRGIEIKRLATLLDNARAKILELEQTRSLRDKSEVDEVIDNARKEKDVLESQVANLQEQLSRARCEVEKLQEQLRQLQTECQVSRNNAKSAISDLEYTLDQLRQEKTALCQELQEARETMTELQVQTQCHLEDKIQLKAVLTETQKHLVMNEKKLAELDRTINEEKRSKLEKTEEWQQFQSDLLLTVRVANDLKTEAQTQSELLIAENKELTERVKELESQLDKLTMKHQQPSPTSGITDASASVLSSVQQDLANRRAQCRVGSTVSRQDSRLSVKSLIESIENAAKQAKAGPGSRSSSTSSLSSIASDVRSSVPSINSDPATPQPQSRHYSDSDMFANSVNVSATGQQPNNRLNSSKHRNLILSDGSYKSDSKPDYTPVSILSSKNVDFARRNSYSDLNDRKDPLAGLVKNGGSKRNALLKWCQYKTMGYKNIDITNFSSSWNDGLGFCALLHTYLPDKVPYDTLNTSDKKRNFTIAFEAAESIGVPTTLNIADMIQLERPDWQLVMAYITAIYRHLET